MYYTVVNQRSEDVHQQDGKHHTFGITGVQYSDYDCHDTNQETGCALLGDVVISLEMAVKQANMYGHSLEREIGFLTVHSMLHLLGYDHETSPLEERKMREKEEEVLGELGISREATFTNQPEDTDA